MNQNWFVKEFTYRMFRSAQEIGPYTLIKCIGRGGFGEVWLAERRAKFVTTKVAIKLPFEEQVETEAIQNEACLWEQASGHPNVLPIIDADEYDGQIVIVSEYAPDGSLSDYLDREGALPVRKAVNMAIAILNGLEYLHSKQIIHRDLKPANILLQGDTPRLTDFGISRLVKTTSVSINMSGTPSYMAPEAFDRKRNAQTDIWSVGALLYEMLNGRLPFPDSNLTDLFAAIVRDEPQLFSVTVPTALQQIVLRALAKSPANRYQTAREMRDDLVVFAAGLSDGAMVATLPQHAVPPTLSAASGINSKLSEPTVPAAATARYNEGSPVPTKLKLTSKYRFLLIPLAILVLLAFSAAGYYHFNVVRTAQKGSGMDSQGVSGAADQADQRPNPALSERPEMPESDSFQSWDTFRAEWAPGEWTLPDQWTLENRMKVGSKGIALPRNQLYRHYADFEVVAEVGPASGLTLGAVALRAKDDKNYYMIEVAGGGGNPFIVTFGLVKNGKSFPVAGEFVENSPIRYNPALSGYIFIRSEKNVFIVSAAQDLGEKPRTIVTFIDRENVYRTGAAGLVGVKADMLGDPANFDVLSFTVCPRACAVE